MVLNRRNAPWAYLKGEPFRNIASLGQLRKKGIEMDLGWIPRGQNAEADALTNSELTGFDPGKRIDMNFEDSKFLVMDKLMEKAATLDEEIKLAKSPKEAKGDRPEDRWTDPW